MKDSKRYKKLLKAQNLIKSRDEALLAQLHYEEQQIRDEQQDLMDMSINSNADDTIANIWIANRLKRNAGRDIVLKSQIMHRTKVLQQENHRYAILEDKHKMARQYEEGKESNSMLGEYVSLNILKDTSLG